MCKVETYSHRWSTNAWSIICNFWHCFGWTGYIDLVVKTAKRYASFAKGDATKTAKNVMFLMGDDFQYGPHPSAHNSLDSVVWIVCVHALLRMSPSVSVANTRIRLWFLGTRTQTLGSRIWTRLSTT